MKSSDFLLCNLLIFQTKKPILAKLSPAEKYLATVASNEVVIWHVLKRYDGNYF